MARLRFAGGIYDGKYVVVESKDQWMFGSDGADALLEKNGLQALVSVLESMKESKRFELPADSGSRMGLTRWLLDACGPSAMLFIGESGVWPSSENVHAFESVRFRKYGEVLPASDHRGELLESKKEYAASLVHQAINNLWDVLLVDLSGRLTFFSSHDEWMSLRSNDEQLWAEFAEDEEE